MIEEKILKGGDKKMAFTIPSLINAYLNIVNNFVNHIALPTSCNEDINY